MTRNRKTTLREWETPRRARFLALIDEGYSKREAASRCNISRSTGQGWLKRGERRTGKSRPGRPRTISDDKMREICDWIDGHHSRRTMDRVDILRQWGYDVDFSTAWRLFDKFGYRFYIPDSKPFLTDSQKAHRLQFALAHKNDGKEYWRKGLYTDETSISTSMRRRQRVLRKRGERNKLDCVQFKFHSGRASYMIWSYIGYGIKGPIHVMEAEEGFKNITQSAYANQILDGLLGNAVGEYPGRFVVEDNAPVHGKKSTKKNQGLCNQLRNQLRIHSIYWPGNSPDLNPIEKIWRILKSKLRCRKPIGGWSLSELKKAVAEVWYKEITIDQINEQIDSMPDRIAQVIERKGAQTQY